MIVRDGIIDKNCALCKCPISEIYKGLFKLTNLGHYGHWNSHMEPCFDPLSLA